MSEKRFKKMDTIIDPFPIWDTVEEKGYNCTDTLDLLVDLLNEQQATNDYLEESNSRLQVQLGETLRLVDKLKEENEQLKYDNFMFKGVIETFQKVAISERKKLENQVDEQQATIEMYQRRVDKREEQISIIKKHCLKFLTDEQIETIRKELENE